MKEDVIRDFNKTTTKFIQDVALYEDFFLKDAPDLWGIILQSLSNLSDTSKFLEACVSETISSYMCSIKPILEANGVLETNYRKFIPNKNLEIDLNKYKGVKKNVLYVL